MICDGMAFVSADFMFQPHDDQENPSPNNIQTSCPPQDFHGVIQAQMRRSMSFSRVGSKGDEMQLGEDEMSDDGSQLGEKKRRLNVEQVKALERSFELGNKLEPERKMELARALDLQPRQIAIWFQNRRARWKTKQLEKDYDLLKRKFQALKADNDALLLHNKKLHAELLALKGRESSTGIGPINLNKETEGSWSNGSDQTSCDFNLVTTTPPPLTADHSPSYSHQISNKRIFHSSNGATTSVANHLLQSSSRSSNHHLQSSHNKIDQMVPDESFCNMFTGIDDHQQGFWPWPLSSNISIEPNPIH